MKEEHLGIILILSVCDMSIIHRMEDVAIIRGTGPTSLAKDGTLVKDGINLKRYQILTLYSYTQ